MQSHVWQYEDLVWGLFMAKYIFPGADASMPLNWVVGQLELAGFEVAQVDNIGVHYSLTLRKWYENWVSNKARIVDRHGERWFRIFHFFLAWSTYIAGSGAATCYQITCHKNLNSCVLQISCCLLLPYRIFSSVLIDICCIGRTLSQMQQDCYI